MGFFTSSACPKCGSQNIQIVEKDLIKRLLTSGDLQDKVTNPPRPLGVCKDCGHTWADK